MTLRIMPFAEKHIEDAAALVTRRYKSLRSLVPMLPERYEDATDILPRLRDLANHVPGVVAIENGQLSGFLMSMTFPSFRGRRSTYSPAWANAAAEDNSRLIYRRMYGTLSEAWAADGCMAHYVTVFADDQAAIDAWFWQGFGLLNLDALRDLSQVEDETTEVEVKRASLADVDHLLRLEAGLQAYMLAAPIFLIHDDEPDRTGWEQRLQNDEHAVWLAWEVGRPVAYMQIGPPDEDVSYVIRDEKTASITGAFTEAAFRRQGVATALLNRCIEWARSRGAKRCAVDFESMNISGSRFWLRYFDPVCYSMLRILDERAVEQG